MLKDLQVFFAQLKRNPRITAFAGVFEARKRGGVEQMKTITAIRQMLVKKTVKLVAFLSLLSATSAIEAAKTAQKPNFIVILVDDMGYNVLRP
jgi:hypothetical protein